ncbi:MAG TPA: 6,7-dimethyl-8-ribityllumazine synthase [Chitinophagales bacterium]|nr:6,7-dimethyl-8-ribityllumazine synthase [Chitinophagales bacterium]HMX03638.1 6,7-dimethyl-8-ribityllumazine synthase [Chitinophagales bacterium]HMZ89508.1 6,7-dimethyl-8-ribityllumazine synthase [Chitinophagales bacterium]HNA56892.1 6,7-dimethyl-8-ribityllumazine synthase [Chitinophagales bacterium]HNE45167.1 6,7-dimethyl-8-ribityllumazine synthase [Chitinophagales bacterium]
MATGKQHLTPQQEAAIPSGDQFRIGIVVSEWNTAITEKLYQGCYHTLTHYKTPSEQIITVYVPGSFELPQAAQLLLESQELDAVICLGCIIKGETSHDQHIAQAVAHGVIQVGLDYSTPVIFGVLTTNDEQQAIDRAGGKHGNKGEEAAITALRMAALREKLI